MSVASYFLLQCIQCMVMLSNGEALRFAKWGKNDIIVHYNISNLMEAKRSRESQELVSLLLPVTSHCANTTERGAEKRETTFFSSLYLTQYVFPVKHFFIITNARIKHKLHGSKAIKQRGSGRASVKAQFWCCVWLKSCQKLSEGVSVHTNETNICIGHCVYLHLICIE